MPGTGLGARDTKMKKIFLPACSTLPLEAIGDIALRRKGKSRRLAGTQLVPQHPAATWQRTGHSRLDRFKVGG